ncbi:hypothetical protein ACSBR2_036722 [Camellia fascicularis]
MAFRDQMKQYPLAQSPGLLDTCYDLSKYKSVKIPQISFLFGGNIDLPLDKKRIVYARNVSQEGSWGLALEVVHNKLDLYEKERESQNKSCAVI